MQKRKREKKTNVVRMNDEATHFPMGDLSPCCILMFDVIELSIKVTGFMLLSLQNHSFVFSPVAKKRARYSEPIDVAPFSHWSIYVSWDHDVRTTLETIFLALQDFEKIILNIYSFFIFTYSLFQTYIFT